MPKGEEWTDAAVTRLFQLWGKYPANQIRDIMQAEGLGNRSRNAIIGKAGRLGLSERKPRKIKLPANPENLGPKTCQWPFGEVGQPGFRFCGDKDVVPGKPYCPAHQARAVRATINLEDEVAA